MGTLEETIEAVAPLDSQAMAAAGRRQASLTKPPGSLGRLEELSIRLAGIRRTPSPQVSRKCIVTMAADHGVVAEGVTRYPQAVTAQMVLNFLGGGAAVNVLARHVGARVVVVDAGVAGELPQHPGLVALRVAAGTRNMAHGPAMSVEEARASLEAGITVVEGEERRGLDILGVGEMGIGNTTAASAVTAAVTGCSPGEVTGRGTGLDDLELAHKVEVVARALAANRPRRGDGLDVLAKVGGFEIGAMAGAMIAAAARHLPVVLDGFICGAAALVAVLLAPRVKEYLVASHRSVEVGHSRLLEHLGLEPLLDLDLRLGEGTGAALGISLAEASCRILAEMATFEGAGVSGAQE